MSVCSCVCLIIVSAPVVRLVLTESDTHINRDWWWWICFHCSAKTHKNKRTKLPLPEVEFCVSFSPCTRTCMVRTHRLPRGHHLNEKSWLLLLLLVWKKGGGHKTDTQSCVDSCVVSPLWLLLKRRSFTEEEMFVLFLRCLLHTNLKKKRILPPNKHYPHEPTTLEPPSTWTKHNRIFIHVNQTH